MDAVKSCVQTSACFLSSSTLRSAPSWSQSERRAADLLRQRFTLLTKRKLRECFECGKHSQHDVVPMRQEAAPVSMLAPHQPPARGGVRVSRWSIDVASLIGSGAFGSVYMARDEEGAGEAVAAKVIDASMMKWEKILFEVRLLSKVAHHEGIIGMYGAHEVANANGRCVVMLLELGTGDLLALLTQKGVLAEAEALRYFREVVGAVEFLHTQRIAHRDLKLENVLISASGTCKLADFGLAHEYVGEVDFGLTNECVDESERETLYDVCGSKSYVAPEVLLNLGYNGYSADVWSLGICLFAMLTGFFPFTEAAAQNAYYASAHKQAAAYGSLTLAVFGMYNTPCPLPPRAVELVDRLLRISPVQRCSARDALACTRAAEASLDGQLELAAIQAPAAALPSHDAQMQEIPSSCDSVSPMPSLNSPLSVSSFPSYWFGVAGESALDLVACGC